MSGRSVAIISGAAGGIGLATVRRFSKAGYAVLALDIDPAVEQLSDLQSNARVLGVVADHERLDTVEAALAAARDLGAVRHIVTFAGVALPAELAHDDRNGLIHPSLFRATLERTQSDRPCKSPVGGPGRAVRGRRRPFGHALLFGQCAAWGEPGYSTAKAGLIGLVRSLAGPYGRRGVRINALVLGTVDSAGAREEYSDVPGRFELMRSTIPLGRLGQADDVADAALAIARDLRHMNGAVVTLDGGQSVERNWQLGLGLAP